MIQNDDLSSNFLQISNSTQQETGAHQWQYHKCVKNGCQKWSRLSQNKVDGSGTEVFGTVSQRNL